MVENNVTIEGARIIFRNFSGEEGKFNPKGKRNFCVLLDEELAKILINDGWNVKYLRPREEDDVPQAYLQVSVSFNPYPPKIVQITSRGKTKIDEDMVHVIDWAEISNVDLVIRPYNWKLSNGSSGVKAYLKTMYYTIVEDEFEIKYSGLPGIPESSINAVIDTQFKEIQEVPLIE